jgi:ferredoxin
METYIIPKQILEEFIKGLSLKTKLFAPVFTKYGCDLKRIRDLPRLWDEFYLSPLKQFFIPERETLFRFQYTNRDISLSKIEALQELSIIFGVKPCDARAQTILDKVFLEDKFKDSLYQRRRESVTLIGISCENASPTCFCESVNGTLNSEKGLDWLITKVGEDCFVKILTEKGKRIIEEIKKDEISLYEGSIEAKSDLTQPQRKIELKSLERLGEILHHPIWERIYQGCLACRICTYLCPTCWCFDIFDREINRQGVRFRVWDSCMSLIFTKQASGYNPREKKRERFKQRIMHKFYYLKERLGEFGCVGCGRCIKFCPVGIDIRTVLLRLITHLE